MRGVDLLEGCAREIMAPVKNRDRHARRGCVPLIGFVVFRVQNNQTEMSCCYPLIPSVGTPSALASAKNPKPLKRRLLLFL